MPWINDYMPKSSQEIIGQDAGISRLLRFVKNFKQEKQRAVLVYGPPGCGKTASVYAIAREIGLETVEINASDFRKKDNIKSILGSACKQMSLFSKGKVILIDELEGISGTKDRGGIAQIASLVSETAFPIILICQDPFEKKYNNLRKKSIMVGFNELKYTIVHEVLKKICEAEKVDFEDSALKSLARQAGGDLRCAINDLQTIAGPTKKLTAESIKDLSTRDTTEQIKSALLKVFKFTDPKIALSAFNNVAEDPDAIIMWLDENIPFEYEKPEDIARAYDALSLADMYRGRIRRRQHWRFLAYVNNFLSAGIALAKDERYKKVVEYQPTTRILAMWQAKMKNMKRKAIAEKVAAHCHVSSKKAFREMVPFYQLIFKKNSKMAKEIAAELELEKDEVVWLKK